MPEAYEHATPHADWSSRELNLVRGKGNTQLIGDSSSMPAVMDALDAPSADGWEFLGVNATQNSQATGYLLRRPMSASADEPPQVW